MRQKYVTVTAITVLLTVTTHAAAGIYKLVDENGRVTYTNAPAKSAQKLQLGVSAPRAAAKATTATTAMTMGSFPKVSAVQQKKRDINRRQILESELAEETRLLAEIQHALSEAAKSTKLMTSNQTQLIPDIIFLEDDNIKKLRNQATLHERNIMALRTELENL